MKIGKIKAKEEFVKRAAYHAEQGLTNCSLLINGKFPPREAVSQLLYEGYDVIYGTRSDYRHETIIMSWEQGCSGKVFHQKRFRRKESTIDEMYKHFGM